MELTDFRVLTDAQVPAVDVCHIDTATPRAHEAALEATAVARRGNMEFEDLIER